MKKYLLFLLLIIFSCSTIFCGDTNPHDDENNRDYHGFDQSGIRPVNENSRKKKDKDQTSTTGGGGSSVIRKKYNDNSDHTILNDNVNDPDAGASSNMDTVPLRKPLKKN